MGKQCWSQAVLESGSWGHSVLQTPALVLRKVRGHYIQRTLYSQYFFKISSVQGSVGDHETAFFKGIELNNHVLQRTARSYLAEKYYVYLSNNYLLFSLSLNTGLYQRIWSLCHLFHLCFNKLFS